MLALRAVVLRRAFSVSSCYAKPKNVLPSTPEMKSQEAWSESSDDSQITRTMVGMAKDIQEATKPPVVINIHYTKKFEFGKTYDPFDYTTTKVRIDSRQRQDKSPGILNYDNGAHDPFVKAGINPLDLYMMPEVLSRFVSQTGQIFPRERTKCNNANQRKLSIAIKRARALGLMPNLHKHNRFMPHRIM